MKLRMGDFFMKDLLLIIDMQNVYLPGQLWGCPSMPSVIRRIQTLLDSPACGKDFDVIFTRYIAAEHPIGRWKQYNQKNADINRNPYLNQIVPELQSYLIQWPFYDKSTYSACSIPQLSDALTSHNRILLTGVVAECCVLATAEGLIDLGAHVLYLQDAVAGQDEESGLFVRRLMKRFSPVHTQVLTVQDYLRDYCTKTWSLPLR